eukprot:6173652-Pleurochrysis_carterae.AAC.13
MTHKHRTKHVRLCYCGMQRWSTWTIVTWKGGGDSADFGDLQKSPQWLCREEEASSTSVMLVGACTRALTRVCFK